MTKNRSYINIIHHYEKCLEKHGDTYLGVDWPKLEDAEKRYQVMLDVIRFVRQVSLNVSLLDFGCGLSHLYEYMLKRKTNNVIYSGLDISRKFVNMSRKKFPDIKYYCVDLLLSSSQIPAFDYIVMNGVFTEKRDLSFEEMFSYVQKVLIEVFKKANKGIAFNVMSKAVDWERDDLFHLSTDKIIQFIVKNLSRNFIVRNDYGLYEYTVYVYKQPCI